MKGSAAPPLPSSPEGSGLPPPLIALSRLAANDVNTPSPKPLYKKRRLVCVPSTNYASKSKAELKNILKAKKLQVGGNRDDMILRLETKDKGQLAIKFPSIVPPTTPRSTLPSTPSTPKRRRQIDEEEEEVLTPSRKELKKGIGDKGYDVKLLIMGWEGRKTMEGNELQGCQVTKGRIREWMKILKIGGKSRRINNQNLYHHHLNHHLQRRLRMSRSNNHHWDHQHHHQNIVLKSKIICIICVSSQ